MENEEYGKCGVWKMRSVENEECVILGEENLSIRLAVLHLLVASFGDKVIR